MGRNKKLLRQLLSQELCTETNQNNPVIAANAETLLSCNNLSDMNNSGSADFDVRMIDHVNNIKNIDELLLKWDKKDIIDVGENDRLHYHMSVDMISCSMKNSHFSQHLQLNTDQLSINNKASLAGVAMMPFHVDCISITDGLSFENDKSINFKQSLDMNVGYADLREAQNKSTDDNDVNKSTTDSVNVMMGESNLSSNITRRTSGRSKKKNYLDMVQKAYIDESCNDDANQQQRSCTKRVKSSKGKEERYKEEGLGNGNGHMSKKTCKDKMEHDQNLVKEEGELSMTNKFDFDHGDREEEDLDDSNAVETINGGLDCTSVTMDMDDHCEVTDSGQPEGSSDTVILDTQSLLRSSQCDPVKGGGDVSPSKTVRRKRAYRRDRLETNAKWSITDTRQKRVVKPTQFNDFFVGDDSITQLLGKRKNSRVQRQPCVIAEAVKKSNYKKVAIESVVRQDVLYDEDEQEHEVLDLGDHSVGSEDVSSSRHAVDESKGATNLRLVNEFAAEDEQGKTKDEAGGLMTDTLVGRRCRMKSAIAGDVEPLFARPGGPRVKQVSRQSDVIGRKCVIKATHRPTKDDVRVVSKESLLEERRPVEGRDPVDDDDLSVQLTGNVICRRTGTCGPWEPNLLNKTGHEDDLETCIGVAGDKDDDDMEMPVGSGFDTDEPAGPPCKDARTPRQRSRDVDVYRDSSEEEGMDSEQENVDPDTDCIQTVKAGEVLTTALAYEGGYPIVTSRLAMPNKVLCYSCGSGGDQMIHCVSCAESFHFFCIEFQFRPKSMGMFVCRNCTKCHLCTQYGSDLRCIKCTLGFHPACVEKYPPSRSDDRSKWACYKCAMCLHCGVRAEDAMDKAMGRDSREIDWDKDPWQCGRCAHARRDGHVCPECGRAYQEGLETVECAKCTKSVHRQCAGITEDHYEVIRYERPSATDSLATYECSQCRSSVDTETHGSLKDYCVTRVLGRMEDFIGRAGHREDQLMRAHSLPAVPARDHDQIDGADDSDELDSLTCGLQSVADECCYRGRDSVGWLKESDEVQVSMDNRDLPATLEEKEALLEPLEDKNDSMMTQEDKEDHIVKLEETEDNLEEKEKHQGIQEDKEDHPVKLEDKENGFMTQEDKEDHLVKLEETEDNLEPLKDKEDHVVTVYDAVVHGQTTADSVTKCRPGAIEGVFSTQIARDFLTPKHMIMDSLARINTKLCPWPSDSTTMQAYSSLVVFLKQLCVDLFPWVDFDQCLETVHDVARTSAGRADVMLTTVAGIIREGLQRELDVFSCSVWDIEEKLHQSLVRGREEFIVFHSRLHLSVLMTELGGQSIDDGHYSRYVRAFVTGDKDGRLIREKDVRRCALCGCAGDDGLGGRLIYGGQDVWVHVNCALWSDEVYEEEDGALVNVDAAIRFGRASVCAGCKKYGATVRCSADSSVDGVSGRCRNCYHFTCAFDLPSEPVFTESRAFFCSQRHTQSSVQKHLGLADMLILRRIYMSPRVQAKRGPSTGLSAADVVVTIGNLRVDSLGTVRPHSDSSKTHLCPVEYKARRLFWSMDSMDSLVMYDMWIKDEPNALRNVKAAPVAPRVPAVVNHVVKRRRLIETWDSRVAKRTRVTECNQVVYEMDESGNLKVLTEAGDYAAVPQACDAYRPPIETLQSHRVNRRFPKDSKVQRSMEQDDVIIVDRHLPVTKEQPAVKGHPPMHQSRSAPAPLMTNNRSARPVHIDENRSIQMAKGRPTQIDHGRPIEIGRSRPIQIGQGRPIQIVQGRSIQMDHSRPIQFDQSRQIQMDHSRPIQFDQNRPIQFDHSRQIQMDHSRPIPVVYTAKLIKSDVSLNRKLNITTSDSRRFHVIRTSPQVESLQSRPPSIIKLPPSKVLAAHLTQNSYGDRKLSAVNPGNHALFRQVSSRNGAPSILKTVLTMQSQTRSNYVISSSGSFAGGPSSSQMPQFDGEADECSVVDGSVSSIGSDSEAAPSTSGRVKYRSSEYLLKYVVDGFKSSRSPKSVWTYLVRRVSQMRAVQGLSEYPLKTGDGWAKFGIDHRWVVHLVEQMVGAFHCRQYDFKYHKSTIRLQRQQYQPRLHSASLGSRSSQWFNEQPGHVVRDPLAFLGCKSNCAPRNHAPAQQHVPDDIQTDASYIQNLASQFHSLRCGVVAREQNVLVCVSGIHCRGLFARRQFAAHDIIIEYVGETIRSVLSDVREARYQKNGVDCYMFRLDRDTIVDATYKGNAARFINHSCQPNCYAKVVKLDGEKHIVIIAERRIYKGEELTYDYRFPTEEDKLVCTCGSSHCRKYLN